MVIEIFAAEEKCQKIKNEYVEIKVNVFIFL